MRLRKQDANGDMQFGSGLDDYFVDQPEGVAQLVETRLLLWAGEWFLDLDEGTPYAEAILGKHSEASANAALQSIILNTDNVTSMDNYTSKLNADARGFSVSCTLNTTFGPTPLEVSNYGNF